MQDNSAPPMIRWMMGGFYGMQWQHVAFALCSISPIVVIAYFYSTKLDIMNFGDLTAKSLGIKLTQTSSKSLEQIDKQKVNDILSSFSCVSNNKDKNINKKCSHTTPFSLVDLYIPDYKTNKPYNKE